MIQTPDRYPVLHIETDQRETLWTGRFYKESTCLAKYPQEKKKHLPFSTGATEATNFFLTH